MRESSEGALAAGAADDAAGDVAIPAAVAIEPCPFCGDGDPAIDEIDSGIWAVCCNGCSTIGPHSDGEHSPELAIGAWNLRALVIS